MEAIARKVAELEIMVNRLGKKLPGGDAAGETAKRASSGVKTAAEKKTCPEETKNTINQESNIRLNKAKGAASEDPAGPAQEMNTAGGEIDLALIKERWPGFLETIRKKQVMIHALAREAEPVGWERGVLTLAFKKDFHWHYQRMEEAQKKSLVEEVLGQSLGTAVSIRCVMQEEMVPGR